VSIFRYIRGEAERSSSVQRDVGNVMADTEITFEYGIRTKTRHHTGINRSSMYRLTQNSVDCFIFTPCTL